MAKETKVYRAKLTDFEPDSGNANKGTQRGARILEESVRQFGAARSLVADAHGRLPAGNKTQEALINAGFEDVFVVETDGKTPVIVKRTDWDLYEDESAARRYAYYDNRSGQLSLDWDAEQIMEDMAAGIELDDLFTVDELMDIGAELDEEETPEDPGAQIDRAEELRVKWGVKTGDLWALGDHRLICGDCTDPAAVERVMGGGKADMMFTDPPYGVNYSGGVQFDGKGGAVTNNREKLKNDDSAEIYSKFLPIVLPFIDGACYMWFSDSKVAEVYKAVEDNGCQIHALIIWHKINATYAAMNAQYKQRHEPCLYFKQRGSTLRWSGPSTECTVWDERRDAVNNYHPTQKPLVLPLRAIGNHNADLVIDPFLGSGTTLIACEKLNRRCRAVEISPAYCAVTLERWSEMTGREPVLLDVKPQELTNG